MIEITLNIQDAMFTYAAFGDTLRRAARLVMEGNEKAAHTLQTPALWEAYYNLRDAIEQADLTTDQTIKMMTLNEVGGIPSRREFEHLLATYQEEHPDA